MRIFVIITSFVHFGFRLKAQGDHSSVQRVTPQVRSALTIGTQIGSRIYALGDLQLDVVLGRVGVGQACPPLFKSNLTLT